MLDAGSRAKALETARNGPLTSPDRNPAGPGPARGRPERCRRGPDRGGRARKEARGARKEQRPSKQSQSAALAFCRRPRLPMRPLSRARRPPRPGRLQSPSPPPARARARRRSLALTRGQTPGQNDAPTEPGATPLWSKLTWPKRKCSTPPLLVPCPRRLRRLDLRHCGQKRKSNKGEYRVGNCCQK